MYVCMNIHKQKYANLIGTANKKISIYTHVHMANRRLKCMKTRQCN